MLSLRGGSSQQCTKQPLCDKNGNVLLWNGEIFSSDLVIVKDDENDAQILLNKLGQSNNNHEDFLFKIFESIKGPYAFIFYEKKRTVFILVETS